MIVLGIDPGTATTGFGAVEVNQGKLTAIQYGVIRTPAGDLMPDRLHHIFNEVNRLVAEVAPAYVAVEQLYFNKNVQSALAVGQARGVVLLAAALRGVTVAEYTPLQVKQAVVGYGRAEKIQVQQMVRTLLKLKDIPKPDDAADALAIAICHAHSYRSRHLYQSGGSLL